MPENRRPVRRLRQFRERNGLFVVRDWSAPNRIVIEGVKDGKYHVINRAGFATGESCKEFCRSLIALANEPSVLKTWESFRREERQSHGYRPEPPQTEDQGDVPERLNDEHTSTSG